VCEKTENRLAVLPIALAQNRLAASPTASPASTQASAGIVDNNAPKENWQQKQHSKTYAGIVADSTTVCSMQKISYKYAPSL
jgi:hypothetical protein